MQLDTRTAGYDQIRDVVLEVVPSDDAEPLLARARAHVLAWNGSADAGQPAFGIVQLYYRALLERALAPLLAPAVDADPRFVYRWPLADEPLRRLLDERPRAPAHARTRGLAAPSCAPCCSTRCASSTATPRGRGSTRPGAR